MAYRYLCYLFRHYSYNILFVVGEVRLELTWIAPLVPKTSPSTNFGTRPLWCPHPVLTRELVITNDLIFHLSIGAVVLDVCQGVEL